MVSLPYNGGEIDEQRLELVEYPAAGSSAALDAIAIVHPPTLSDVERHVLAELGPDSRGENLGPGLRCYAACAVGGALLLTVAATLCGSKTYSTADREKRELQNRLTDDAVSSLGPAATARELLAIRRAMLSEIEEA
ncbi:hypothetical protein [Mycolicibacterium sp.]|uniref:hypothetical protein n=1 Tax=Mycolicibacterium sp. TaxID=2320850 RepID=UPI001A188FE9|nr:hypothetical protein [Mycolicibacterium sp.]MBJ7341724.1 hypothetical protein [Mycolicibacterium sp.]